MRFFERFEAVSSVKRSLCAIVLVVPAVSWAQSIVVASTTSTEQSGLFGHILQIGRAHV